MLIQAVPGARATFPGHDGRLLFSVYPSPATRGLDGLWSLDPSGRNLTLVAKADHSSCAGFDDMRYSPDGRRIAYYAFCPYSTPGPSSFVIYTMNADGTGRRALATSGGQPNLAWSPDGRRIAFVNSDSRTLTIVDSSSGRQPRTNAWNGPQVRNDQMSWGTDDRIRFDLYSVRVDGRRPQQLDVTFKGPPGPSSAIVQATWSPSGQEVAVVRAVYTTTCLRGGAARPIYPEPTCGQNERDDIYVVSARGGLARRITKDGGSTDPIWSPDGQSLAFYDNHHEPGISIIAATGGRQRVIGTDLRLAELGDWQPR